MNKMENNEEKMVENKEFKKVENANKRWRKGGVIFSLVAIILLLLVASWYYLKEKEPIIDTEYIESVKSRYQELAKNIEKIDAENEELIDICLEKIEELKDLLNEFLVECQEKNVEVSQILEIETIIKDQIIVLEEMISNVKDQMVESYIEKIESAQIIFEEEYDIEVLEESNEILEEILEELNQEMIEMNYLEESRIEELIIMVEQIIEAQVEKIEELREIEEKEKEEEKEATSSSSNSSNSSTTTNSSSSTVTNNTTVDTDAQSNSSDAEEKEEMEEVVEEEVDPYSSYSNTTEEAAMLKLINDERESLGLEKLVYSATLYEGAKIRGVEITTYFSHTRPDGSSYSTAASSIYAENIALGTMSASAAYNAFYNSAGHKANMLNESYKTFSCNRVIYNGVAYWVQLFGR